jgi:DNA-binding GntR family transcriptional regulator
MLIAQWLRTQIEAEKLRPGEPAPTIREISDRHGGCARATVSKALLLLAHEGLLIRYPGLGYYIAGPAPASQDHKPLAELP